MGRRGGTGASRWVYLSRIVGWGFRREGQVVGVKDDLADVWGSLIAPPGIFAPVGREYLNSTDPPYGTGYRGEVDMIAIFFL